MKDLIGKRIAYAIGMIVTGLALLISVNWAFDQGIFDHAKQFGVALFWVSAGIQTSEYLKEKKNKDNTKGNWR